MRAPWGLLVLLSLSIEYGETKPGQTSASGRKKFQTDTIKINLKSKVPTKDPVTNEIKFSEVLDLDIENEDGTVTVTADLAKNNGGKKFGNKNQEFYAGESGSFAQTVSEEGDIKVSGTFKVEDKRCFLDDTEQFCWDVQSDGFLKIRKHPDSDYHGDRRKRQVNHVGAVDTSLVAEIAYVTDDSFLDWFRVIYGSESLARRKAEHYIYLLTNEMNYIYSSLTNYGQSLYLYPVDIIFPPEDTDWSWLEPHKVSLDGRQIIDGYGALDTFSDWFPLYNGAPSQYDTAQLLIGMDIATDTLDPGLLGVAWFATTCRVSNLLAGVTQDFTHDTARIAAHEIAHGLGAEHDDEQGVNRKRYKCDNYVNVMSAYLFDPDPSTRLTYKKFSKCSSYDFQKYISYLDKNNINCLKSKSFTRDDFVEIFCNGSRGENFDVDKQCQKITNDKTSVACNVVQSGGKRMVYEDQCWDSNTVECSGPGSDCDNPAVLSFVMEGTPCIGDVESACIGGSCQPVIDYCAVTTTTTTVAPPCNCTGRKPKAKRDCCRAGATGGHCCTGCNC